MQLILFVISCTKYMYLSVCYFDSFSPVYMYMYKISCRARLTLYTQGLSRFLLTANIQEIRISRL